MSNRQTKAQAKAGNTQIDYTQHETDSPLLPVGQIERLQHVAPDRVDWVFKQTEIEAEERRSLSRRQTNFIFAERILGLASMFALCAGGIVAAYFVAMAGHEWPAVALGCTAPIGVAGAYFRSRNGGKR